MRIQSTARIIGDSLKLAQEGKTFKTRLSRCELVAERAQDLVQFEQKGIPTISPPPSELVREAEKMRDEIILESAEQVAMAARDKAEIHGTPISKSNALKAGYIKAKEVLAVSHQPNLGAEILVVLRADSHKATLDGFIEAAHKAEFKGNAKKAIDQYQEALFYIRNDDIPDEQQTTEILEIESALERLQGS